MENEFSSEKLRGHRPAYTRKEYSEMLASQFDVENIKKTKIQESYRLKGTKKYVKKGIMDRLTAKPYNFTSIDPIKASNDIQNLSGDERSYYYGYYVLASEKIAIQIKYPNIARLVTIREVGYNDAQDSNISLEELPEEMKSSKEYLEGYKKGLEEIQKKYKHK